MHHEATTPFLRTRFAILKRNPRTSRRSKSLKRKPSDVAARWSAGSRGTCVTDGADAALFDGFPGEPNHLGGADSGQFIVSNRRNRR
jgi:hypothetical protein